MSVKQLSFEDCFITRNRLRSHYGLPELYPCNGEVIIPLSEIETEKKKCQYWQYYNASCKAGVAPKCITEWEKDGMKTVEKVEE